MFPHLLVAKVSSKYWFYFLTVPPSISTLLLLLQVLPTISKHTRTKPCEEFIQAPSFIW